MIETICTRCKQVHDRSANQGEILEDSEDNFVWYCEECVNYIRPVSETRPHDKCQWCKQPLKYKERLPFDIVLLHLGCYDSILKIASGEING